ncbi:5'-3' exoribonuclease 1 [Aedes albopictus]|uniref:5'-3' exoribonuclease 1 n=1 Tax=Aedes albopictus TaxID=7160 RepID=A0ABM1Z430_AEDAL|nr:5'-3' exoribonuclease 1-like [Aedes albopictus]
MGVPKFFRYISERYPCLSELIRENQVPEFDNLYLDMNGIIHNCSHPNDSDVFFRITEEKIFSDIFHYLEFLFRMIRPQKLFFIAVDGVAPRAKMNQQRGRRFRSAREAQEQMEEAQKKGEVLPTEARFDSNCITPGTSFMVRLQRALEHFIKVKVSTNPLWKHCKVILSGHETPGEGEHKIMEYIRYAKASPDFDSNTRHCLYGLDADLIMLGLCTHEKHFSLLREEVKFGKNDKKSSIVEETRFYLLHLTLMREYLELEFAPVRDKLKFEFNIYKLIDDWVLMGYMVGNDFIPHLPHLHINENALPTLFQAYMDILPSLDGYINEGGILNMPRLEVLMNRLARFDRDIFLENYTDLKYFKSKRSHDDTEAFDVIVDDIKDDMDSDLSAFIKASSDMFSDEEDDLEPPGDIENDPEFFEKEFNAYKRNYYITKLGYQDYNEATRAEQTECYIRALQWTLLYYYRGVPSWAWYYPHHYAPFISDLQNISSLKLDFEQGKPFLPFQQLLSVLPSASKDHLPSAYHTLMTDPNSPVVDYYPENFETDLNGKQQAWEAVVLIPFIDEKRLLKAMEPCDAFLTDEEKQRNVHGPMLVFQYDSKGTELLPACYGLEEIEQLKVKESAIYRDQLHVVSNKLVLGPSKGAILDGYIKGFPTMKHLQYHGIIKEARVKVFNFPSRNPSMVVVIDRPLKDSAKTTETLARELLGRIVFVSWPHLSEAKVVKVADAKQIFEKDREPRENNEKFFDSCCRAIVEHHNNRLAIDLGKISQLVHVKTCVGTEYVLKDNRYVLNKLWNIGETMYPVQAVVTDLKEALKTLKPYQEIREMFPENCLVFLRATQWYGSLGHVLDVTAGHKRIKTRFEIHEEPNLDRVVDINEEAKSHYLTMQDAASMIGISANLLSRLSSTIYMMPGARRSINVDEKGKMNIGLQLRMVTQDIETVGYTRKVHKSWMFSEKAIELIKSYHEKVPNLFERLEHFGKGDILFEDEVFGEHKEEVGLKQLVAWIKSQDHAKAEKRTCGTKTLEPNAVEELVKLVNEQTTKLPTMQTMFVHPKDLYKPGMKQARSIDHQANYELLDRVIIARDSEVVPLGYRGTIIGIHMAKDPNPVRQESVVAKSDKYFDVLFDKEFPNGVQVFGIPATKNRVVRVAEGAVLNISFGTADLEYKQVDPSQPIILPAEEFINRNNQHTQHQRKHELVRIHPQKPTPTAESIKKRLNERIEKKNPNKAFILANRKPLEETVASDSNSQTACDFERLWHKLRESSQVPSTFDDRDIKSFISPKNTAPHPPPPFKTVTDAVPEQKSAETKTGEMAVPDPSDMLRKMLRINSQEEKMISSSNVPNGGVPVNRDSGTSDKPLPDIPAVPPVVNIPMPKNLPKPPSSWRSPKKSSNADDQLIKTKQQTSSTSTTAPSSKTQHRNPIPNHHYPHVPPSNLHHNHQPLYIPFAPFNIPYNNVYPTGPPVPTHPNQFHPMPRYQQAPPQAHIHQQQQLYNAQYSNHVAHNPTNLRQRGPKGPQNLSFNRNTPAGTGAFVPLQAMIKSKNRNNNTTATVPPLLSKQPNHPSATAFAQKNAEQRQMVEQKQEEIKQSFASFLADNSSKGKVDESVINPDKQPLVPSGTTSTSDKLDSNMCESDSKLNEATSPIVVAPPKQRQMRIAANFSQAE